MDDEDIDMPELINLSTARKESSAWVQRVRVPPAPSTFTRKEEVMNSDFRIRSAIASTRPNASGRSTLFAQRLGNLTPDRVKGNWTTDNTYVRGHRRNLQVLSVFVAYICWFCESQLGLAPLAHQEQQVLAGNWTLNDLNYGGFKYVEGSLFPVGHVMPAFSLGPYLSVSFG